MVPIIRRLFFILLLFLFACTIYAQDDFGMWYALNTEVGLSKKVDFKLSGSIRTFHNATQIEQSYFEIGLQYKFAKNFSAEGYYRFIDNIENDGHYYYRHRFTLDLNASLPISNLSFFVRARLQRLSKTYIENDEDLLPHYSGRIKLGADYRLPGLPLKPYAYFESFTPFSPEFGPFIDKYRLSAGTEIRVTRSIIADISYIFQRDFQPSISNIHILSLELDFKL
jgi:hypothetical protein